ncbi:hypothetical protein P885DRAFT_79019 [Corynascus similis CBS 632.67]
MDFVELAVVASPFANLAPLYEADPDADALLIVPPPGKTIAVRNEFPRLNGVNGGSKGSQVANGVLQTGLRIKVSSKHLVLASRVFRNKLQFGNTRAARQSDGRVHLRLAEGFNPSAVSIVINAIHGRGPKVPKTVDLETLTHIALFVDRFQLLDAVEVYADRWISNLERSDPNTISQDPIPWVYISHVFRQSDTFKTATKLAAAQSSGPIATLGLPIKEKIIHHIDAQRQALLARALTPLHQAVETLTSGGSAAAVTCRTHHCDALLLGELVKSLQGGGRRLVWPRPTAPFVDLSFSDVVGGVREGLEAFQRGAEAREEAERKHQSRQKEVEVEPWYMKGVPTTPNGKANGGAVWGVVNGGGKFPITPVASPEPVYATPRQMGEKGGERHRCQVAGIVASLEGLAGLGEEVEGLVLESRLGYLLY